VNVQSTGRLNTQLGAVREKSVGLTLESLGVAVSGPIATADKADVLTSLQANIEGLSAAIDLDSADRLGERLGGAAGCGDGYFSTNG